MVKKKKHILIVASDYYLDLAKEMIKGAVLEIKKAGASHEIVYVPGAFEIPAALAFAAKSRKYDGYVALGIVIRGETTHYDYVCMESARGLNDLAIKKRLPIGYGIITAEDYEQAKKRAMVKHQNKGGIAAAAALKMIKLKEKFDGKSGK